MKIIKLKEGDNVPENTKFLYSKEEPNYSKSRIETREGIIFSKDYRITPLETVFYYEVEE